jgi:hypothetical protein
MSTIRVDNFGPSAGGTTYSARGIAKAWVNFNGTGTIAARDSENVSSLTDNGTGIYNVNFSNAFGAADYAAVASGTEAQTRVSDGAAPTASSVRILTNSTDSPYVSCSSFGDLA